VSQVLKWLEDLGYANLKPNHLSRLGDRHGAAADEKGHGEGVFVVIAGEKSCAFLLAEAIQS
jgi:hypothetical protein